MITPQRYPLVEDLGFPNGVRSARPAIVEGRGFSDPFVIKSGPTAWMPPLLVWIQAGLIWLFDGDRYWVMLAVVFLKSRLGSAVSFRRCDGCFIRGRRWLRSGCWFFADLCMPSSVGRWLCTSPIWSPTSSVRTTLATAFRYWWSRFCFAIG